MGVLRLKPQRKKGKVVRLSPLVMKVLNSRRKGKESYDSVLRRFLSLPSLETPQEKRRKRVLELAVRERVIPKPPGLRTYWVLDDGDSDPVIARSRPEARGLAVLRAARKKRKKTESVIQVRELP